MVQWADFPWKEQLNVNTDEAILTHALGSIENAYGNAAGGHSRFPGLRWFSQFSGDRVYLHAWRNDLIAATGEGRVYRIGRDGTTVDVTGVPVSGGKRTIFSDTEEQVCMASGGPIISLSGEKTEVLSRDAPNSTHVAFVDGYLIAIEALSNRFSYCDPGAYSTWNPLSVFSADGKPDDLVALAVTPYRELMMVGSNHIDQFERLASGIQPFSRRWSTGEGVAYPYTLIADKTGTYGINGRYEFVRFFGQISQDSGTEVGLLFEHIDDWTDAWTAELSVKGQKCFVLQMPAATNAYGTKGVTLLLDYRNKRWSLLYGWDPVAAVQTRWPVWSTARCWGKVFAGVPGGVAVFDDQEFSLLGNLYPLVIRSGHIDKFGPSRIDELRIRLKRGVGHYGESSDAFGQPHLKLRVNRDNDGWDQWQSEPMGAPGDRTMELRFGGQGSANTWQFEIALSDPVAFEFVSMQIYVERLRW